MSLGRVAFKGLADAESSPVAQLGGGCNPSGSPSPWAPARFGPRHDEHRARVAPRAGWPPAAASTSPPASLTSRASSTLTRTRPRSWAVARSQTAHIARLESAAYGPPFLLGRPVRGRWPPCLSRWCTPHPAARLPVTAECRTGEARTEPIRSADPGRSPACGSLSVAP
jgi:hypothetical protein